MYKKSMSLSKVSFFTDREKKILESCGFDNIYDIITLLPNKLEKIAPLEISCFAPSKSDYYIFNGVLKEVNLRKKNRVYFELVFENLSGTVKLMWFGTLKLSKIMFETGQTYQVLCSYQKNFYKLSRISKLKENLILNNFKLGSNEIKNFQITRYPTIKNNFNTFFKTIFNKIPRSMFVLDLYNLVPINHIIPTSLDLHSLHFPGSEEEYVQVFRQFMAFKLFLKLSLRSYYNFEDSKKLAIRSEIDKNYLTTLSNSLPFQLNLSQKNAIWEILTDFSGK